MKIPISQKTKKNNGKLYEAYYYANLEKKQPDNPFDNAYVKKIKKKNKFGK